MIFDLTLYASLLIFLLGLSYRISAWFRTTVGLAQAGVTGSKRLAAAARGILGAVASARIFTLLKIFLFDILLQFRILREKKDPMVWMMHISIFIGFTLLLLFHALDKFVTAQLFEEYYSTLNPFMFLRDFLGAVVLFGLILAVIRRIRLRGSVVSNSLGDIVAIGILALIIISGFLLEGAKISSYSAYESMVEEYAALDSKEAGRALEAFWVRELGVVSPNDFRNVSQEILKQGRGLSEMSCSGCHANPRWAFLSYGAAALTRPVALSLDRAGYPKLLWYLHFLSCFFGLAYLPFSKFFHIIATPVSLLVNGVIEEDQSNAANIATKLSIEFDGCKHGGACHSGCEVQKKRQMKLDHASKTDPFLGVFSRNLHIERKQ